MAVVDLFCGCGGMTLGTALAARRLGRPIEIRLAVDADQDVLNIYRDNFARFVKGGKGQESKRIRTDRLEELFDGQLGMAPTDEEIRIKRLVGRVDLMLGGPPCQGNSDLNNHTRRRDPRNGLYARMARAARVLRPRVVVIENVPPVVHDQSGVVKAATRELASAGYTISEDTFLRMDLLGVPQTRKRHFLVASRVQAVDVFELRGHLLGLRKGLESRTVRWAMQDVRRHANGTRVSLFDTTGTASEVNQKRIDWLVERDKRVLPDRLRPTCHRGGGHSYKSIYGRMDWDAPAQTITTGFGSMGQGCYVHPSERRTITPHEAARLQTFPDFFRFGSTEYRTVLARAIGNAVPPLAMREVATAILQRLRSRS